MILKDQNNPATIDNLNYIFEKNSGFSNNHNEDKEKINNNEKYENNELFSNKEFSEKEKNAMMEMYAEIISVILKEYFE